MTKLEECKGVNFCPYCSRLSNSTFCMNDGNRMIAISAMWDRLQAHKEVIDKMGEK